MSPRGVFLHKSKPPEERFWAMVDKNGPLPPVTSLAAFLGPCWIWLGAPCFRGGYGDFRVGKKLYKAHVYVLLLEGTPPPVPGEVTDHLCRRHLCVNPQHLERVTPLVNSRRGKRAQQTHCLRNHEYTPENTGIHLNGTRFCLTCVREQRKVKRREVATA